MYLVTNKSDADQEEFATLEDAAKIGSWLAAIFALMQSEDQVRLVGTRYIYEITED